MTDTATRVEKKDAEAIEAELAAALSVIWNHAGAEGRTWLFLNFPGWSRKAAFGCGHDLNPYLPKDWTRPPPSEVRMRMPREGIDY